MHGVRIAANAPAAGVDTSKDPVAIHESVGGYTGPLCETVTVQVEFWKLIYGSAGAGEHTTSATEAPPDHYFDMDSVKRTEQRVDGRKELHVKPPEKLYAGDRSVCAGALVAVYAGKPLKSKELPEQISSGAAGLQPRGQAHRRPVRRARHHGGARPAVPHADVQLRSGRRPAFPESRRLSMYLKGGCYE
ncbi:UNVERIFIED_CONTAM: hypothetical protein RKD50_008838 [Streptomyces canus]